MSQLNKTEIASAGQYQPPFARVALILLTIFASTSVFGAVRIIFPLHYEKTGHLGILGWALGMFPLTALLFSIPFGAISDRFSPKKLLLLASVAMAIFPFGLSMQFGIVWDFTFLAIGGIANSIFVSVGPALYQKLLTDKKKTQKIGLFVFFKALAWGCGLFAVMVFGNATESLEVLRFLSFGGIAAVFISFFLPDSKPFRFKFNAYLNDINNRAVITFLVLVFGMSFHFGLEGVCLPLFIKKELTYGAGQVITDKLFSTLFAVFALYMAISSLWLSQKYDKPSLRGRLFFFGLLAASVSNIAVFWIDSLWAFLAWRLLHLLGDAAYLLSMRLLMDNLFDKRKFGGPFGLVTSIAFAATWLGMMISNMFVQYGDLRTPFVLAGMLPIMLVGYAFFTYPNFGSYEYPDNGKKQTRELARPA